MTRRRPLSEEERALWSGYARSIKPLRAARAKAEQKSEPEPEAEAKPSRAAKPSRREAAPPPKPPVQALPLAPFDRRMKQRVARGHDAIEARIDLHGMTQSEAHDRLMRFLRRAQTDGVRIALVVTGKGGVTRDGSGERGVLRRQVPLWLALPEFRPLVVGFDEAHGSHGGQGALYVRLRRPR